VADIQPRRHDLVWLDPEAPARFELSTDDRPLVADWLQAERPLVAGRREPGDTRLRMGFTVPGLGARRRVGVLAPLDTLVRHAPPPLLAELIEAAPISWRTTLIDLATDMAAAGHTIRAYGSLVNQHLSGQPCLRPDSDLDVLVDCANRAQAIDALHVLARFSDGHPRIDGELRMAGWAVAWRELAGALGTKRSVLTKSDIAVRLMAVDDFLDATHREAPHADQRIPDPLAA
jgi:phosphoribosyl-dephospho-CoA transferase